MTDVSKELLPCPFCGGSAKHMGGHVRCTNDACPVDVSALTSLDWNTRAQPAPSDVVERVARALVPVMTGSQEDQLGRDLPDKQFSDLPPDWQDAYRRYAKAALSAIPVSGEVERLREALRKIERHILVEPSIAKIARQALKESSDAD